MDSFAGSFNAPPGTPWSAVLVLRPGAGAEALSENPPDGTMLAFCALAKTEGPSWCLLRWGTKKVS